MTLFDYQKEAVDLIQRVEGSAVFADPGLGKTLIALESAKRLGKLDLLFCALVIAPLNVIEITWPEELAKWAPSLSWVIVHGTKKQREKALAQDADIYLINPEGVNWLSDQPGRAWSLLVVDESTKFKNRKSDRFRAIKAMLKRGQFGKVLILSGTPTPNGLMDLWAQMWIVDQGGSLGRIGEYQNKYFRQVGDPRHDRHELLPGKEDAIYKRIAPVCLRLDAKDYRDLPPLIINTIKIQLPPKLQEQYDSLERDLFAELEETGELLANNRMHNYHLCRQFASGAVYDEDKNTVPVHDLKVQALLDLLEQTAGPVLIGYHYVHEFDRLKKALGAKVPHIGRGTTKEERRALVKAWNRDRLPVLVCYVASSAHGLNLHEGTGRDIVFFSMDDDAETYDQFRRRIYGRTGVTDPVKVHHLICKKTIDVAIMARHKTKEKTSKALLEALKAYKRSKDVAR